MSVIVKAQGPADLLAMMPSLIGFTPQRSFVLLAFRGKRTCGAIRFNLPSSTTEAVLKRIATNAVGTLCKISGVDSVVVAIFTDEAIGTGGMPHSDFADVLGRRLRFSGFGLRESLCQASDGWGSYCDADTPDGGHPLSDIANSPVVANLPPEALPDDADTPARVPDAPAADKKRVSNALARYRRLAVIERKGDLDSLPAELDALGDLTGFVEKALDWDESAIRDNDALLLFVLQGPPMRDTTMLQWASSLAIGDVMMDEAERWNRGGRDLSMADVVTSPNLMFGRGPRPDPERIERGIQLLLTVVSRAEDAERLSPLCMLAWLNWALGRGSRAGRYIDEARAIDPNYGMAELLDTMLSNGMLPEWAFAVPTDSI
ncbi:DUF4192 domain-containing protein [Homoserinimonas sp. A447]